MAFFSLPVIYPFALAIIKGLGDGLLMKKDPSNTSFARRSGVRLYHVPYLILATLFGLAIIHYNTIIHPFTLADNRHYIFYIFRYSIRRNEIAKYTLAPVYVACGYVLFLTFGGLRSLQTQPSATAITAKSQAIQKKSDDKVTQIQAVEAQGNGAVFTVIWFGASALSLITAPLVEPRYFIIPWVIWRLNLPPLPVSAKAAVAGKCDRKETSWIDSLKYWAYEGHDHRLWLETAWFLLINVVTGYVFLFRGFEWPSEPGLVQRFMW
jgi:alpha-1,2-glucosyltransferase